MTDPEVPAEVDEADWAEQHHQDTDRSRSEPSVEEAHADTRPAPSEADEDVEVSDEDWPQSDE